MRSSRRPPHPSSSEANSSLVQQHLLRQLGHQRLARDPLARTASQLRLQSLDLSTHVDLSPSHSQPVTALGLEDVEGRYLLSSSADASIALYDVLDRPSAPPERASADPLEPLAKIGRAHEDAHKFAVSSVAWFPHDTGAFVTGGYDELVKLWDTNEMRVACEFTLPGRVQCVAMSAVATTHALIAVAGAGNDIRLIDPSTGSATHTLGGHRAAAWTVCWSPRSEHTLVSGGADGCVRLWDLRRATGWLSALDMHDTSDARQSRGQREQAAALPPPPAAAATAASGGGAAGRRRGGGGGGGGGSGGGGGGIRCSGRPTTMAGRAAALAQPVAHHGAVTSLCFVPDGSLLVTAGRDHRVRLWTEGGVNTLTHYAGAHNAVSVCKQIGVCEASHLHSARLYFPTVEGLIEYELMNGTRLRTLKGHFGGTSCCVADSRQPRVFSGGEDGAINAWTPPPCGVVRPMPSEPCTPARADAFVPPPLPPAAPAATGGYGIARDAGGYGRGSSSSTASDDGFGGAAVSGLATGPGPPPRQQPLPTQRSQSAAGSSGGGGGGGGGGGAAQAQAVTEDVDAWSDDDDADDEPPRGHRGARKRMRRS